MDEIHRNLRYLCHFRYLKALNTLIYLAETKTRKTKKNLPFLNSFFVRIAEILHNNVRMAKFPVQFFSRFYSKKTEKKLYMKRKYQKLVVVPHM